MNKFFLIIFLFLFSTLKAEIVEEIVIEGNKRVSTRLLSSMEKLS